MKRNKFFLVTVMILMTLYLVGGVNSPFNFRLPDNNMTITINAEYSDFNQSWTDDSLIVAGLGDVGSSSNPIVFQKNGTWYLIAGEQNSAYNGYNWTGSFWQADSAIIAGLSSPAGYSTPTVFQMSGIWYLITGEMDGTFRGYNRTGSAWVADTSIITGLGDVGDYSTLTVFRMNNTVYLISGEEVGNFFGFNWTGTAWQSDLSIASGLVIGAWGSTPTAFNKDGIWYLISGGDNGAFYGFRRSQSSWTADSSLVNGLGNILGYSAPTLFQMLGNWQIIAGKDDGTFNGFRLNEVKTIYEGTKIKADETNSDDSDCTYTLYRDGIPVSNPNTLPIGLFNYSYATPGCENFSAGVRTVFVNVTSSIENVTAAAITNETTVILWDTMGLANSTINYGTHINLGNYSSNSSNVTSGHQVPLTNLLPRTQYYFNVTSCDNESYCSQSGPYSFTTLDFCKPLFESYTLLNNVSYTGTGYCFLVYNNSITLDCNNYLIAGNNLGTGFAGVGYQNITLVNCDIQNFQTGLIGGNSSLITIVNTTAKNNTLYDYFFSNITLILESPQMFMESQTSYFLSSIINSSQEINFSNQQYTIQNSIYNHNITFTGTSTGTVENSVLQTIFTRNDSVTVVQNSSFVGGYFYDRSKTQLINLSIPFLHMNIINTSNSDLNNLKPGKVTRNISVSEIELFLNETNINILSLEIHNSSVSLIGSSVFSLAVFDSNIIIGNITNIAVMTLNNSILNSTSPSNISLLLNLGGNNTIYGQIYMPPNIIFAGNTTRFYPTYIINYSGLPEINTSITVKDNNTVLWNSTTDTQGYIEINLTFNSTSYNKTFDIATTHNIGTIGLGSDTPINVSVDIDPPNITDYEPKGILEDYSTDLRIWTDELATCRYFTINDTNYYNMNGTFSSTGTYHSAYIGDLTNGDKTYYVKCMDKSSRISRDFEANFTVSVYGYVGRSGGGGGGGFLSRNPTASHSWSDVLSNESAAMDITHDEIAFTKLEFNLKRNLKNIEVNIEKQSGPSRPTNVNDVYQTVKIYKKNFGVDDIETATLWFKVSRAWKIDNNLTSHEIKLYKFIDSWVELPTEKLSSDSKYDYYKSTSSSFSTFSIVAISIDPTSAPQNQATNQTTIQDQPQENTTGQQPEKQPAQQVEQPIPITEPEKKGPNHFMIVLIALVIIIISVSGVVSFKKMDHYRSMKNIEEYIIYQKTSQGTLPELHANPEVEHFIKICLRKEIDKATIKKSLIEVGWKEDIIDYYMIMYG